MLTAPQKKKRRSIGKYFREIVGSARFRELPDANRARSFLLFDTALRPQLTCSRARQSDNFKTSIFTPLRQEDISGAPALPMCLPSWILTTEVREMRDVSAKLLSQRHVNATLSSLPRKRLPVNEITLVREKAGF